MEVFFRFFLGSYDEEDDVHAEVVYGVPFDWFAQQCECDVDFVHSIGAAMGDGEAASDTCAGVLFAVADGVEQDVRRADGVVPAQRVRHRLEDVLFFRRIDLEKDA